MEKDMKIQGPCARILLADDESETAFTLALLLQRLGYQVAIRDNGRTALESLRLAVAQKAPYDLLICDIRMPVMTGEELLAALHEQGIELPVIVITGYGNSELLKRLINLGCNGFIDKPISPADFGARVSALLASERTSQGFQKDKINKGDSTWQPT